jgi:phenylpyruvate tautomerase PptA (4-oxalocrotonate tautomerase family)
VPMIDVYAATGTFPDTHKLAVDAAAIVREVEQVPDIPMFRQNTAAFAIVQRLTELVVTAANEAGLTQRTWVPLTEAVQGGWGLWGRAHTNDELVGAARAAIAKLRR